MADLELLFDRRLPSRFARQLYELCEPVQGTVYIYREADTVIRTTDPAVQRPGPDRHYVDTLVGAYVDPRCLLIFGDEMTDLVLGTLRPSWYADVRFLNSLSGHGRNVLTLTSAGADKGIALGVVCEDLGIALSNVVAMGDSETDVEMFRVAGASIAMGQASPEVQASATWVTASNADDGVAEAIDRILSES